LFVRFIEVDGGLYIKIGLEAEYYTFATNYDEVNNLTESVLGEDSITLKSGRYGIIHTNGTKSFNIQTVGSLTEMLKIKSEFDEEIKKNTKYVYNTRNDAYLDLENRISASCHIVNGTNTGDRYHLFRLHIIYGAFESEPADFASYSDSGISDIPLMSNFPELPQLSGKKAYRVVSSTESEVRIEVNKDFEFYNNYYSKLKSYGFNGNSKTVGDVTYKFLEDYSYYGTHDMYVFSATTNWIRCL